jgi:methyl-accepting chemotaxis protein
MSIKLHRSDQEKLDHIARLEDEKRAIEEEVQELRQSIEETNSENAALHEKLMNIAIELTGVFDVLVQLSEGDMTQEAHISDGDDLLRELSTTLNTTIHGLRILVTNVRALAEATDSAASNTVTAIQSVSSTLNTFNQSTAELAQTTHLTAERTQEVMDLVRDAGRIVEQGSGSATDLWARASAAKDAMEISGTSMEELSQKSNDISKIVVMITDISEQTNLLALNAAIEAARAGEAGRGFAVVAQEVRKLADSSRQSADTISALIRQIQADTGQTLVRAKDALAETIQVMSLTEILQTGYHELLNLTKRMSSQVADIAANSEETAASTQEIAAGVEIQTGSVEGMAKDAAEMASSASSLIDEISRFKLAA